MKKKIILLSLILIAVSLITLFWNRNKECDLLAANIEALSQTEGSVTATCLGTSVVYRCYATCNRCGREWETFMSSGGPAVNISGRCYCGCTTFRTF